MSPCNFAGSDNDPGGGQRTQHHFKTESAIVILEFELSRRALGIFARYPRGCRGQPPNACESAVRWGIAVIGTQMAISAPTMEPMHQVQRLSIRS